MKMCLRLNGQTSGSYPHFLAPRLRRLARSWLNPKNSSLHLSTNNCQSWLALQPRTLSRSVHSATHPTKLANVNPWKLQSNIEGYDYDQRWLHQEFPSSSSTTPQPSCKTPLLGPFTPCRGCNGTGLIVDGFDPAQLQSGPSIMSSNSGSPRDVWQPGPTTMNQYFLFPPAVCQTGPLDISTYSLPPPAVTAPSAIIGQNIYPWSEYVYDEPVMQGSLPGFALDF